MRKKELQPDPIIAAAVPASLKEAIRVQAASRGCRSSDIVRDALKEWIERNAKTNTKIKTNMDHTQIAKMELPDAGDAWKAADTVAKVTDVTRKIAASDAVKVSLGCELFERRPAWNVYHDGRNGIGDTPLEALDQLFPNRREAAEARLEEVRRVMDKLSKRIPELADEEARLVKELEGER